MRILQLIDSMELNGGSTMFLETVRAMKKHWTADTIAPFVVSKTGKYGRKNLIDEDLPMSYGINDLGLCSYQTFQPIADKERDSVIFHHILGHTKPIRFHASCKYILINHTMTNVRRLKRFRPFNGVVSVCKYFADQTRLKTGLVSTVVLNKISDNYIPVDKKEGPFIIGRCQRIVPSKFKKAAFDDNLFPRGYRQVIVGPINSGKASSARVSKLFSDNDVLMGAIFDRSKKLDIVRTFDVYLHSTPAAEGASIAVLEALSCGVPVLANRIAGGIRELIKDGVNGYLFKKNRDLNKILSKLQKKENMQDLRESTREDFLNRLHIKHSLKEYKRLADG